MQLNILKILFHCYLYLPILITDKNHPKIPKIWIRENRKQFQMACFQKAIGLSLSPRCTLPAL